MGTNEEKELKKNSSKIMFGRILNIHSQGPQYHTGDIWLYQPNKDYKNFIRYNKMRMMKPTLLDYLTIYQLQYKRV